MTVIPYKEDSVRVVIDGKLELHLTAPPREGEIISCDGDARRVETVTWVIPDTNMHGQAPSAEDISVHVQREKDWREGLSDTELHAQCAHPDFEYRTTEGPRKQWDDADTPPLDENFDPDPTWERNTDAGRDGWERFDYTEESYWRRRKQP